MHSVIVGLMSVSRGLHVKSEMKKSWITHFSRLKADLRQSRQWRICRAEFKSTYPGDQKCTLLAGKIRLKDVDGDMREYTADDTFIPAKAKFPSGNWWRRLVRFYSFTIQILRSLLPRPAIDIWLFDEQSNIEFPGAT